MMLESANPATGERLKLLEPLNDAQLNAVLDETARAVPSWQATSFADRGKLLRNAAARLRADIDRHARLITLEMGKLSKEARAEVEKCALGCDYIAEHGEAFLRDEVIKTEAHASFVAYQPLGTVLAIMPWNFPYWQVFRAAASALMAGNTVLLKHASNVPQCALAIESVFHEAGFPKGVFRTLLISAGQAERLVADRRIHAVTLTGSESVGRKIAAAAGTQLKKTVLELGGSDAFVVLDDADLELAATQGAVARMQNCGQSCIAAKRFVLVDSIADDFVARLRQKLHALVPGDPALAETTLAPMARADLREQLHKQVIDSIHAGAKLALEGGPIAGPGFFFAPTILDHVKPGARAFQEELFGPVATILRAKSEDEALHLANDNRYGLGGSVWTKDIERGRRFAMRMEAGATFVNAIVKSDPRLPFGGIKASGYGRELAMHGTREFVNIKTVWIK